MGKGSIDDKGREDKDEEDQRGRHGKPEPLPAGIHEDRHIKYHPLPKSNGLPRPVVKEPLVELGDLEDPHNLKKEDPLSNLVHLVHL